jgi:hypothetical protein
MNNLKNKTCDFCYPKKVKAIHKGKELDSGYACKEHKKDLDDKDKYNKACRENPSEADHQTWMRL